MKKIALFFMIACSFTLKAQSFEGIIKWTIKSDITDPAAKAQLENARKKMNDPANQAELKEMQARMNDPEFKAMLEANPQMKAQVESAMKMMQSGGDMSDMMPKGMTVKVKQQNALTKIEGGVMDNTEMLYLHDKNQAYRIDRQSKTYSVLPQVSDTDTKKPEVKVTKTNETTRILNHTCTKYIVESTDPGNTMHMQQFFWTTTEIKDFDLKSFAHHRMGKDQPALFYEQIAGVPLKIEMRHPKGTMVMEVVDIKRQPLNAVDFTVPSGFKEMKGFMN
jgi:hypothetical protein